MQFAMIKTFAKYCVWSQGYPPFLMLSIPSVWIRDRTQFLLRQTVETWKIFWMVLATTFWHEVEKHLQCTTGRDIHLQQGDVDVNPDLFQGDVDHHIASLLRVAEHVAVALAAVACVDNGRLQII
eukprot:2371428-Amphidinium_carterae.1